MSVMRIKDAQGHWQEVAALHGLPGTSVSITSITQSTEDDGYSVVTFSDGKTLRVKNGSKGSAGEGGAGGGVTIVHVTEVMNGAYETDMMAEDIYARYSAGERVVCHLVPNAGIRMFLSPIVVTDTDTIFSGIFDAQGQYTMSVSVTVTNDTKAIITKKPLDKLPNPKPLTINGTSYDGSEAVNIDIAAAGGDNKWTSFYTNANIGGTNRAEYKTDSSGRSFAFSAAMVQISVPAASSASWVDIAFWNDGGTSTTLTIKPGINTTASLYRVYCYVDHGRTKIWCPSPVESSGDAPTDIMLPAFNNEFVSANTITRVIVNGRMSFPANTYCTVWGVNA